MPMEAAAAQADCNRSPNRGKQETIPDLTRLQMQFQAEKNKKVFKTGMIVNLSEKNRKSS